MKDAARRQLSEEVMLWAVVCNRKDGPVFRSARPRLYLHLLILLLVTKTFV